MSRRWWMFLLTAVLSAMPGCAVDSTREVAEYRRVIDLPDRLEDRDPAHPLTLPEALWLANRLNERLDIEGENYLQALIERRRAAAAFQPTVDLSPVYAMRDRTNGGGSDNNGNSSNNSNTFDVPLGVEINLFNGFRDIAALKRQDAVIDQRQALLLDTQEQLLLDVAQVYYDVLRAERSVQVLRQSLAAQDERVRDIRGKKDAGVARPLEVAQIEAQASGTRVALLTAERNVKNGRTVLSFLTAAPLDRTELVDSFELPQLPTLEEMAERGAEYRADLRAAYAAVLAAKADVDVAIGQYYPSVSLEFNYFLYRESSPDERLWDAFLRANLPIFSAGLIEQDVREAWSRLRQALLVESSIRRQVEQDVKLAYQDLLSSEARLAELRVQLSASEQQYQQANQSYLIGLATNLERVIAQDQLLVSQLELSSEAFNRKVFYLNLLRATGQVREALEAQSDRKPSTQPVDPADLSTPPATEPAAPTIEPVRSDRRSTGNQPFAASLTRYVTGVIHA